MWIIPYSITEKVVSIIDFSFWSEIQNDHVHEEIYDFSMG